MRKIIPVFLIFLFCAAASFAGESFINQKDGWYKVKVSAESGMLIISSHSIQFGKEGTLFDYKEEGNQDVIFPFMRFEAELRLFKTHSVVFLYQPLKIVTKARAGRELSFYDISFSEGTPLDIKYGFSFYRVSYLWNFIKDDKNELGAGVSLQFRNASIIFAGSAGEKIIVNENVGPVPILKLKGEYHFDNGLWCGIDADGFYASDSIFNGADYPFTGAIWDVSFRAGLEMKNGVNPYINFRCLGGGAKGTSQGEDTQGDGYTENWLNTYSLTLGILID